MVNILLVFCKSIISIIICFYLNVYNYHKMITPIYFISYLSKYFICCFLNIHVILNIKIIIKCIIIIIYIFLLRVDCYNVDFLISGNVGIWTFTNPTVKYFSLVNTLFISHIILFKILIKKLNGSIKKSYNCFSNLSKNRW